MLGLTKKQREVLDFIEDFIRSQRYSPSFREIMEHFGFHSLGSVHKHVHALIKKGFLKSEGKAGRSLALTREEESIPSTSAATAELPLMGQFAPGEKIETFSQTTLIAAPLQMVRNKESTYVLRLKGDTLHHEQLQHGDLLLVEARSEAETGEMVMLSDYEGHMLLKRYEGDHGLPIQGIVVGLIRVY